MYIYRDPTNIRDNDKQRVDFFGAETYLYMLDREVRIDKDSEEDLKSIHPEIAEQREKERQLAPIYAIRAICVASENDLPVPPNSLSWLALGCKNYLEFAEDDSLSASLDELLGLKRQAIKNKQSLRAITIYEQTHRDDEAEKAMDFLTGNIFGFGVEPASQLVMHLVPGYKPKNNRECMEITW